MTSKRELKAVIIHAGEALRTARTKIGALRARDLELFCDQKPAPPEAITISAAMCILLGVKPNWKYAGKVLRELGARDFLVMCKPYNLPDEAVAVAAKVLQANRLVTRTQVYRSPLLATQGQSTVASDCSSSEPHTVLQSCGTSPR